MFQRNMFRIFTRNIVLLKMKRKNRIILRIKKKKTKNVQEDEEFFDIVKVNIDKLIEGEIYFYSQHFYELFAVVNYY